MLGSIADIGADSSRADFARLLVLGRPTVAGTVDGDAAAVGPTDKDMLRPAAAAKTELLLPLELALPARPADFADGARGAAPDDMRAPDMDKPLMSITPAYQEHTREIHESTRRAHSTAEKPGRKYLTDL